MNFPRIKPRINSLQVKFAVIAVLTCLVCFGLAAFFSIRWMTKEIQSDYREKANLMGTHIIHDLGTTMVSRNHDGIHEAIVIYQNYPAVEEVRIFGATGEEIFLGGEKGRPEARVEEAIRTGNPIDFYQEINQRPVTSFIFPIKNQPQCHQCHGEGEPLRGALLLSLNQEELKQYIQDFKKKFLGLFTVLALGIIVVTITGVNRFFLKPLGQIQKGAEIIQRGDLHHPIPVNSKNEIGHLAKTFNHMAQALFIKNRELVEHLNLVSRARQEWQETFDCITEPIAVLGRDCRVLKANRAFQKVFDEIQTEVHAKNCSDLFGSCWIADCPHHLSVQERKATTAEFRSPISGKLFEVSVFPYNNPEGEFVGSVFISKDITEKKENEMRLIINERLAALGQMASGLAHEINNPLATIGISAEGLLKRVKEGRFEPGVFQNYLGIIREELQRTRNIADKMLSFVRKRGNEKKAIQINGLLDRTVEAASLQGRMEKVEVLRHYQEDLPLVKTNEGDLRQVLLAVLINALDAMQDKGRLTLETGSDDRAAFIKVSDTGDGIPPELMGKIFAPFFTTKSERGGTGLGLAIAEEIIRENHGKIEVVSAQGTGTTFKITLPLSAT